MGNLFNDSDSMIGQPAQGGGTWGDAFDLIVHYQYGGNFDATVKALGDQYTIQDPVKGDIISINKFNQRGYMRQKSTKKDFEKPEPLAFVIRSVDLGMVDDDGNSVTSAILDSTAYEPPKKKSNAGRGKNQVLALTILDDLYEKHRITLFRSGYDPDGAKVKTEDWKDACQNQGMSRPAYCKVWQSLESKNLIKISGVYVEKA